MKHDVQQVEELFITALDHSTETRTAFLRRACAEDAALIDEVSSMLRAHEQAHTFLETPAFETNAFFSLEAEATVATGDQIGNYTVVSLIARGGMGEVYLAEDAELRRKVAIKLIRRHSGVALLEHLRREARILARLNHPGIARLYGAGITNEGVPYFVMEYVEGERLDRYIQERKLSVADKLTLFRNVCAAVSYAHHHLVIHRDLKPANIRVTAEGEPKLLDFGIARVLDPETTTAGEQTRLMSAAMTPDYASPEQRRGELMTTASDVYSLGIILFEMLSGGRYLEGGRISLHCNSDLSSIVAKALRIEPELRYRSVEQLSDDVQRHLRGLPVLARKGSARYRAGKFIRRHRLAVIAALLLTAAIVGGAAATAWQARLASRARRQAESVSSFLEQMISYSNPYLHNIDATGRDVSVNDVLDAAAKRLESGEFDKDPTVKAELERAIADSYSSQGRHELGNQHYDRYIALASKSAAGDQVKAVIVGAAQATRWFGKGELRESEAMFRKVLPQLRYEHARHRISGELLISNVNEFGYLRRTQGDSRDAEAAFREALSLSGELPAEAAYVVPITRSTLASTLADEGKFNEALITAREAVEDAHRLGLAGTPAFGFSLTVLGGLLTDAGDLPAARQALTESEAVFRRALKSSHLWLGDNLRDQAWLNYKEDRLKEAISTADKALNIYEQGFGRHYDQYPTALIAKGLSVAKRGNLQEGEALLRDALQMRSASLPPNHFWVAQAKAALGECLAWEHREGEALPLLVSGYDTLKTDFGPDDPRTKAAGERVKQLPRAAFPLR